MTRIAISNIAWHPIEEADVADELATLGIDAIELAPTKVFSDPVATTQAERDACQGFWAERGIEIVAFQSMLFGRPDLQLFDAERPEDVIDYLTGFIELAGQLGARKLVFGSPRNRRVPAGMEDAEAWDVAVSAFSRLGGIAFDNGTVFCIEPNPVAYDCNFVVTAAEGAALVREVAHPGFGLHLDTAAMALAGDDSRVEIRRSADMLQHVHASAPHLEQLEDDLVDHAAAAAALGEIGYAGLVSIEMRPGAAGTAVRRVRQAVALCSRYYGDSSGGDGP